MTTDILWFSELGLKDLDRVGGKNASLGEMVQNLTSAGVQVPDGFATTADAYRSFLADSGLDQKIADRLVGLDTDDVTALAAAGQEIRALMRETPFLPDFEAQIRASYQTAGGQARRLRGPLLGRPLQRDGGRPSRRLLRRPAGNLPERPRHREHPARHQGCLRVPLQRPGHRLPRAPQVRARRSGPLGGRPAHGAFRRRRLRRHVHHGHRIRVPGRRLRHLLLRPRRGRRPGRRQPGRVLRLQAGPGGRPPGHPQARTGREGPPDDLHEQPRSGPHH